MFNVLIIFYYAIVFISPMMSIKMITRNEWGAVAPKQVIKFIGPAPFVIIHHSYIPEACNTTEQCKLAMIGMQRYHQIDHGWNDIGYTYAIGGDGNIYEGRGFNTIGAHAPKYNDKSVGICLIGDWQIELPSDKMLDATRKLINYGLVTGHIHSNYTLLGHRQVRDTVCPGDRLFKLITTWQHFSPYPTGPNDINTSNNIMIKNNSNSNINLNNSNINNNNDNNNNNSDDNRINANINSSLTTPLPHYSTTTSSSTSTSKS